MDDDAERIKQPIFRPESPFVPSKALLGQNDYIDILGDNPDALKPHEVHYHMPRYLRGERGHNDYQQAVKLKAHLDKTAFPEVKPKEYEFLTKRINRRYKELRKTTNQYLWKNYKGVKGGPVNDSFKSNSTPF